MPELKVEQPVTLRVGGEVFFYICTNLLLILLLYFLVFFVCLFVIFSSYFYLPYYTKTVIFGTN